MKVIRDEDGLWLAIKIPDGEINDAIATLRVNPPVPAPVVEAGIFIDERDGQTYETVKMPDGKVWMAENLNYKVDGSWVYDNDEANSTKYGRLYAWEAAKAACPPGWRLPTRKEWDALIEAAGGEDNADKKLKARSGWKKGGNGTDEYGFSALPGGYRYTGGNFYYAGDIGYWWTATEDNSGSAYLRHMDYNYDIADEYGSDKGYGFSVRCVKD